MGNSNSVFVDVQRHPGKGGRAVPGRNEMYTYVHNGKTVNLWVKEPSDLPGYKVTKHQKRTGEYYSIYQGSTQFHGFNELKNYTDVYAYFWQGDDDYTKPLVIQLGDGDNYYISDVNSTTWSKESKIAVTALNQNTLKNLLDRENCKKNGAHIMDISKGKEGPYKCSLPTCKKEIFAVSFDKPLPYAHSLKVVGSSITRFENKGKVQNGLPFPRKVDCFYMYLDLEKNEETLLICIEPSELKYHWHGYTGPKWYRRDFDDKNKWIIVDDKLKPDDPYDSNNIVRILLEYLLKQEPIIYTVERPKGNSDSVTPPPKINGNPDFTIDKITHLPHLNFRNPEEDVNLSRDSGSPDYGSNYPLFPPEDISSGDRIFVPRNLTLGDPEFPKMLDEDPVYPVNINVGPSVPPYGYNIEEFEIDIDTKDPSDYKVTVHFDPYEVLATKEKIKPVDLVVEPRAESYSQETTESLENKATVDFDAAGNYGYDLMAEIYTRDMEGGKTSPNFEIKNLVFSDSSSEILSSKEVTKNVESTNPVTITVPYIDKSARSDDLSGLEGKPSNNIYTGYSGSPSITYGGDAVYESYNTTEYEEYRGTASDLEVEEHQSNYIFAHTRDTTQPTAPLITRNTPVNIYLPQLGKDIGYLQGPLPQSSGESSKLEDISFDTLSNSISGSGTLVEEDYNTVEDSQHGYASNVEIDEIEYKQDAFDCAINSINSMSYGYLEPVDAEYLPQPLNPSGVDGSPIADVPKGYLDPTLHSDVQGTPVAQMAEDAIDGERLKQINALVTVQGSSISLPTGYFPSPLPHTGIEGTPIDLTTIVGESHDTTITFDSSPVDIDYCGKSFIMGGSNLPYPIEENNHNLYSVEEHDDTKVEDIRLETTLPGESSLPNVPTLPVCIADPFIICCWWWYLLLVIIVLLVIILICVLCRRSIKVLIVKV